MIVSLLASPPLARALDSSSDVSQYAHKAWKVSDGFFNGPTNTIEQTPDGYLWIGTDFGLYRFDGVRSVPWSPGRNASLPSNLIRKLFVSGDGTLWIGTEKGLASWKDNKLTLYPKLPAKAVDAFAEDGEGTVWVGLEDTPAWRLCSIQKGSVRCFGDNGSLGLGKGALLIGRKGGLWAGTGTGLWQWKPGSPKSIDLSGQNSEIHAMVEDEQVGVLVSTRGGLVRVANGSASPYRLPGDDRPFNPFPLLADRDGSLWIGTVDQGLLHVHDGRTDRFGKLDGLSSNRVNALFQDREGNVWVGTSGGLDHFREYAVSTMPESPGFSASGVESVLPTSDGSIWLGTRNGLDRWRDGRLTLYRKKRADLPSTVQQVVDPGLPDDYQSSLFEDHRGRIWTFSRTGASYLDKDGHFVRVPAAPGGFTHSITEDSHDGLWISQDQGLFHLQPGGDVQKIPWDKLGVRDVAFALASDPSGGGLWLGFFHGDVAQFQDGQIRHRYTAAEGLGKGRVNKLQADRDGTLWAATEGGLSRLKNGRIDTLGSKNGLPCDSIHDFVRDHANFLWLHTGCGLVRITGSSLEAWIGDPKRAVEVSVFGNDDGLAPIAVPPGLWPRMGKARDGRIWFVAGDGVGFINPLHLPYNSLLAPVRIEQVTADGKTYEAKPGLRLPALVHDLSINYSALSLTDPEKVRFRYRLEGQDEGWREVVNDREVQYSNLAPGNYRFRVIASNNSGVWNEEGASLDFVIPPAWFQTNWFRGLFLAAFLTTLWAANRYRWQRLQREEKRFREAIESMPALAFVAEPDGTRSFLNKRWLEYTGMSLEQASSPGWQGVDHPDDRQPVHNLWQASLAAGETFEYEVRLLRDDGEYRWFLTRVAPVRDKRGKIVKWCGVASDIEDRKQAEEASHRLNRELRALSDCNQFLLRATDEQSLLDAICHIVCEQAGYRMAWVGFAENDEAKSVRPVAWAGVEEGYLASAQPTWADTEYGQGPVGISIRTGQSVFLQDFATDPRVEPWREKALQRGYRSSLSVALKGEGDAVFGSFTVYSTETDAFNTEEIRLLEELAGDLAFGITVLRGRIKHKRVEDEIFLINFALNNMREAALLIDEAGRLRFVNEETCRALGYSRAELLEMNVADIDPWIAREPWPYRWRNLRHKHSLVFESRYRRKDGQEFPIEINANYLEYKGQSYAVTLVRDITERKRAEQEIELLAFYDPLTSLPNRRLLMIRLQHALVASRRHRNFGAVFFIDLDNFKQLNDTLGHKMGDNLLCVVARRIAECLRDSDTVARLGGDEFIVLVEDIGERMQDAVARAEAIGAKVLAALAAPYDLEGAVHHATASLGMTLFSDADGVADELMQQADIAMYQAKSSGRNTLRFFDPQMQAAIASRAELEEALRNGIERAEFLPYFQPILHAARGVVGAEVLLRWNRPGHGVVEPGAFIALAEETGLILPIWGFLLENVCRLLASWNGTPLFGALHLSVNVGVQEFFAPDFVAGVGKALAASGAPAASLTLELTESLVIRDVADTIAKMKALKDLGVRISLDDFGTGYSSLAYLARLPLDEVKIDQSFVFKLPGSPADAAVVQSILSLGNSLDLSVVAEGVETAEQHAFLIEHGCQVCQGYLLGRPMAIEAFVQWVSLHPA